MVVKEEKQTAEIQIQTTVVIEKEGEDITQIKEIKKQESEEL